MLRNLVEINVFDKPCYDIWELVIKLLKMLHIYGKNQSAYLALLLILVVVPLGLFFRFSPYPLPYVQYAILAYLFLSQYAFFNERNYRHKIASSILLQLQNELKRSPSKNEIIKREKLLINLRFITLAAIGLLIFLVTIFFKKL